jgi:hypothetical protein
MSAGRCDGCGAAGVSLVKLSLGRDFFGRVYDRLSPSTDQSPKWYCEPCSMHKNLQRDFRDIKAEFQKWQRGEVSELASPDNLQKARLRVHEITSILAGQPGKPQLLDVTDVRGLMTQLPVHVAAPPVAS